MADPLDLARAVWPGEWRENPEDPLDLWIDLPTPIAGDPSRPQVSAFQRDDGEWCVRVSIGDASVQRHGIDLADTLRLARDATVRDLTPLLRAIGADLITAALAATE